MLHQQHTDSVSEPADELANSVTFRRCETCKRLIQQQNPGRRSECQTHVDQSLATVGQVFCHSRLHPLNAKVSDQVVCLRLSFLECFESPKHGKTMRIPRQDRYLKI